MPRFAFGRSSKLIMGVALTASVAGAALAAEAVRTRASDATPTAPLPRAVVQTRAEPSISPEAAAALAHEARLEMFKEKVAALKEVQGSFWGPAAPVHADRRMRRRTEAARLSPPSHPRTVPAPSSPPVLLPPEQLRVEVGQSDSDCLAQAVYFEARGEPAAGQAAVAQVVMNRVRSPYYPKSVCGVVFQGAAHAGCQFSFACDGSLRRGVRDVAAWSRAQAVAAKVLQGEENAATLAPALNYHADYVRPKWAKRLARLEQIGRHIFYQAVGGLLPEGGRAPVGKPVQAAPTPIDRPLPAWA